MCVFIAVTMTRPSNMVQVKRVGEAEGGVAAGPTWGRRVKENYDAVTTGGRGFSSKAGEEQL